MAPANANVLALMVGAVTIVPPELACMIAAVTMECALAVDAYVIKDGRVWTAADLRRLTASRHA